MPYGLKAVIHGHFDINDSINRYIMYNQNMFSCFIWIACSIWLVRECEVRMNSFQARMNSFQSRMNSF